VRRCRKLVKHGAAALCACSSVGGAPHFCLNSLKKTKIAPKNWSSILIIPLIYGGIIMIGIYKIENNINHKIYIG
jgi:hypothetical protein